MPRFDLCRPIPGWLTEQTLFRFALYNMHHASPCMTKECLFRVDVLLVELLNLKILDTAGPGSASKT